jgi:diadenosine tetraphosphate (Ap4A) HIT family hydrolase
MTKITEEHVDLNNARKKEQRIVMEKIIENNEDPFSMENLKKYHKKPILMEGKWWVVTENQWPYPNKKNHFLIIYKEDVYEMKDINPKAFSELLLLSQEVEKNFGFKGGALCMRFGATSSSGATVKHIHAQLIEPIKGEVIKFWIGQEKKETDNGNN